MIVGIFPGLLGRGLIEAAPIGRPRRFAPSFPGLLGRGLIEARGGPVAEVALGFLPRSTGPGPH